HFGRGIVGTPNDFGYNGERPSHPALLDWLAVTFMTSSPPAALEAQRDRDKQEGEQRGITPSPHHLITSSPVQGCSWQLKPLHRLILLSNTYRQSSRYEAKAAGQDADAHLLWRFPPQRLEGEAVRDAMLCISGQM